MTTHHRPPQPPRPSAGCLLCPCRWRRGAWHWEPADTGYYTCGPCAERLATWLREIRTLYTQLDPTPAAGGYGHRGGFGARSPARDLIIALTDPRNHATTGPDDIPSVFNVLAGWAERSPSHRPPRSVSEAVGALLNALPWFTRQDWVGDFELELAEVRAYVRAGVGETSGRRPDGTCTRCTRPLWADPDHDTIHCRCGAQYDRRDWPTLRRPRPA